MPLRQPRRASLLLKTGQTTQYSGELDDGYYQVGQAKSYTVLDAGQYSGTTNIVVDGKTDVHSNNCVLDNNTGLMWSRYVSASTGPGADGKMPWTDAADDIFQYCAAANTASLAGHADWRVPNRMEMVSIINLEAPDGKPSAAAFPGFPDTVLWTSSTRPDATTSAWNYNPIIGDLHVSSKVNAAYVLLVRGG